MIALLRSWIKRQRRNLQSKTRHGKGIGSKAKPQSAKEIMLTLKGAAENAGFTWKTDVDMLRQLVSSGKIPRATVLKWRMAFLRDQGAFEFEARGSRTVKIDPARREIKLRDKAEAVLYEWGIREQ